MWKILAQHCFRAVQVVEAGQHEHDSRLRHALRVLRNLGIADDDAELGGATLVDSISSRDRRHHGAQPRHLRHQLPVERESESKQYIRGFPRRTVTQELIKTRITNDAMGAL